MRARSPTPRGRPWGHFDDPRPERTQKTIPPHILYNYRTLTRAPSSETFGRRVGLVDTRPLQTACGEGCDASANVPRSPCPWCSWGVPGPILTTPDLRSHTNHSPTHSLQPKHANTRIYLLSFDRRVALVDPRPLRSACGGGCDSQRPEGAPGPISTTPRPKNTHTPFPHASAPAQAR